MTWITWPQPTYVEEMRLTGEWPGMQPLPQPRNSLIMQAQSAKEEQKERERQLKAWVNGNPDFDMTPYVDQWQKSREAYKQGFLRLVVESMSIADAVAHTNQAVQYGLKMKDAGIEFDKIEPIITKLFRVQVAELLLSNSTMDAAKRDGLINRFIAQEFPTHDGPKENKARQMVLNLPRPPKETNE